MSGEWLIVFVSADGRFVRDVLRLVPFDPSRISAQFAAAEQSSLLEAIAQVEKSATVTFTAQTIPTPGCFYDC